MNPGQSSAQPSGSSGMDIDELEKLERELEHPPKYKNVHCVVVDEDFDPVEIVDEIGREAFPKAGGFNSEPPGAPGSLAQQDVADGVPDMFIDDPEKADFMVDSLILAGADEAAARLYTARATASSKPERERERISSACNVFITRMSLSRSSLES